MLNMVDNKFNKDNFDRYFRIECIFYQLFEYFHQKYNLDTFHADVYSFGEDFFHKTNMFTKVSEKICPWMWIYTDENGKQYNEKETFNLIKKYIE